MTNPFPVPHKKEWADLGPYRAQVNAATRASEAAMAKKGRKGGKPKLFARSTDLSRDRRAQKRAAGISVTHPSKYFGPLRRTAQIGPIWTVLFLHLPHAKPATR